jgi:hypothetical protein
MCLNGDVMVSHRRSEDAGNSQQLCSARRAERLKRVALAGIQQFSDLLDRYIGRRIEFDDSPTQVLCFGQNVIAGYQPNAPNNETGRQWPGVMPP